MSNRLYEIQKIAEKQGYLYENFSAPVTPYSTCNKVERINSNDIKITTPEGREETVNKINAERFSEIPTFPIRGYIEGMHYYDNELGIDGTSEELYDMILHNYADRKEVCGAVEDILYKEGWVSMAKVAGYYRERFDEEDKDFSISQMKIDIATNGKLFQEEIESNVDGVYTSISFLHEGDTIVIATAKEDLNDGLREEGANALSVEEFMDMTQKDLERAVNETFFYANTIVEENELDEDEIGR